MRVLVVEDNMDLCANICDFLESEGFIVDVANDGLTAIHVMSTQEPQLVVLDIMLPGLDGLEVCRHIRKMGCNVPILMLTARDTLEDKLKGFRVGTDDYLVKPFDLEELAARIRALAQRGQRVPISLLKLADLEFHLLTMEVRRAGQPITLNHTCLRILKRLMERAPNVVTREELVEHLWGDFSPASDALKSHMYLLRKAVDKPFESSLIHTVRNIGFKMVAPQ